MLGHELDPCGSLPTQLVILWFCDSVMDELKDGTVFLSSIQKNCDNVDSKLIPFKMSNENFLMKKEISEEF